MQVQGGRLGVGRTIGSWSHFIGGAADEGHGGERGSEGRRLQATESATFIAALPHSNPLGNSPLRVRLMDVCITQLSQASDRESERERALLLPTWPDTENAPPLRHVSTFGKVFPKMLGN